MKLVDDSPEVDEEAAGAGAFKDAAVAGWSVFAAVNGSVLMEPPGCLV
jgi:hypothetical protein